MVLNSYFEIEIYLTYSSCSNVALAFTKDAVAGWIVGFDSRLLVIIVTEDGDILAAVAIIKSEVPLSIILAVVIGIQVWLTMAW